jgi:hypothetical protein
MTQNPQRLLTIVKVSRGAVNGNTAGTICSYLRKYMPYGRAKLFVRSLIRHNAMRPTSRGYGLTQRLYPFLPSRPAIAWEGQWEGFGLFFDDDHEELYEFDVLCWLVRKALMNGELQPTWESYFIWSKLDPRCHSKPSIMKEYTTQARFFFFQCKPALYCFRVLRLLVRDAVAFQGLKPTWRAYARWCKLRPLAHVTPRLMKGYTTQDDFFGVVCRKRKRS